MDTVANENVEELKKKISKLEFENTNLKDELLAVQNSLYLQHTIAKLNYSVTLNREEIKAKELTKPFGLGKSPLRTELIICSKSQDENFQKILDLLEEKIK
jgi:hypothetical protein